MSVRFVRGVVSWSSSKHRNALKAGLRSPAKQRASSLKSTVSPDEATDSQLVWHNVGPWKRIVASKTFYQHNFPAPHSDVVESVIDYHVPVEKFTQLAQFDGSVIVERTAG